MRVLIAGAGAIGQWLGARLQAAGHDVTLLARPRFHAALQTGLVVRGATTFEGPVACIGDPSEADAGSFDAAIITCKAGDTAAMAHDVAPLVASDGVVGSLQNGLGNIQKLLRVVPPGQAAAALTSNGVTVEAPGRIYHAGAGPTLVGPALHGHDAAARILQRLLEDAGLDPEWRDDMRGAIWAKAVVNAGINPVGAAHGARNGQILANPELLAVAQRLVTEAVAVAAAAGVPLAHDDLQVAMTSTLDRTANNKCSMLQDVEARRATEIDQITGRLVRLGRQHGVPVDASAAIYDQVKALEAGYLGAEQATRLAEAEAAHAADAF